MVEPILDIKGKEKVIIRMSVNPQEIISKIELGTSPLDKRLEAINKLKKSGYSVGILVAPIILVDNWKILYEELLKQLQEKVKILHKKGITLGDFNMANFLFENKTDNLKFIDIDNYAIDGLKSDIKPDLFEPYFNNKIGDNNEVNFDKFNFALMAIRILAREKMSDFDYHMIKYSRDLKGDYLKDTYIPRLDVDNEIKEYLFHLISEDKNKEYFNNLDKLKSKESFIKVK
jgi:hypothetical protein